MIITEDKTVAEIVTENINTAHIFKKYGIDFCCGGGISIKKACSKKEMDYSTLEKELSAIDETVNHAYDYDSWNLSFLIDHIINIHHKYVAQNIPLLLQYANKVAKVHGHHYREVVEINSLFTEVANELSAHMQKEEHVLFPFIKQLEKVNIDGSLLELPHFGTVKNPVRMMEDEHENAGNIFKTIATLSNNYTPPEEACNTYRAFYAKLDEFEQDLHQHIHLENNILHPKAIALEKKLTS